MQIIASIKSNHGGYLFFIPFFEKKKGKLCFGGNDYYLTIIYNHETRIFDNISLEDKMLSKTIRHTFEIRL